jgi:hypothetical protein
MGPRVSIHRTACLSDFVRQRPLSASGGETRCDTDGNRHPCTFGAGNSHLEASARRLTRKRTPPPRPADRQLQASHIWILGPPGGHSRILAQLRPVQARSGCWGGRVAWVRAWNHPNMPARPEDEVAALAAAVATYARGSRTANLPEAMGVGYTRFYEADRRQGTPRTGEGTPPPAHQGDPRPRPPPDRPHLSGSGGGSRNTS